MTTRGIASHRFPDWSPRNSGAVRGRDAYRGSAIGPLVDRRSFFVQLSVLVTMNAIAFMVSGIADTVPFLAVLLAVGGLVVAPAAASESQVAGLVATPGRTRETFT